MSGKFLTPAMFLRLPFESPFQVVHVQSRQAKWLNYSDQNDPHRSGEPMRPIVQLARASKRERTVGRTATWHLLLALRHSPLTRCPVHRPQMAQLQKSLLASLLLVLLSSSFTSAGFVSPGNSVWVGESPTLRYLLACGHLATKPPYFSTHDIYTLDQVFLFVFSPVPVFETHTSN